MDNDKEIEKIAKSMCADYAPYCGCGCCAQHCQIEKFAKNLIDAGYGNIAQAVEEFKDDLKDSLTKRNYHILGIKRIIEELFSKLYGKDN